MAKDYLHKVDGEELDEGVVEERHLDDDFFASLATQAEQDALSAALTQADSDLQDNIDAEAATRGTADSDLQDNIDAVIAEKGVADGIATTDANNELEQAAKRLRGNLDAAPGAVAVEGNDLRWRNAANDASHNAARDSDLTAHKNHVANPHNVTKSQVGLGNVDNVQQETPAGAQAKADAVQTNLNTHKGSGDHDSRHPRVQTGTFSGNGANSRQIAVAFRPRLVCILADNSVDNHRAIAFDPVGTNTVLIGSGGTGFSNGAGTSIEINASGFLVGGNLNASSQPYKWVAYR